MSSCRHGANAVLGIGRCANQRRVPDPARCLGCHAAGRRRRGKIAVLIDRDRADGAMTVGGCPNALFEHALQRLPAPVRVEIGIVDHVEPLRFSKSVGP